MAFKGTTSKTALQISDTIENVGGNINAYTSKEITAYTVSLLGDDLPLGIDILTDILQNSIFDEDELNKERGTIIQEIQKGFLIKDRLLRPSMVGVSKKPKNDEKDT